MPLHTSFLPLGEPLQLRTGLHEELHLHLLKLTHAENELAGHNLVAEGLTYLGDTEGNLHTTRFLDVQVVDENTLSRLRTQVNLHRAIGR